ncbi:MAG: hypothetical protein AB4080_16650 [Trichodesmium sp.]
MSQDSHKQAKFIAGYLNTLIREIEQNPEISTWVVRQVLKTVKDKAEQLADELEDEEINYRVLSTSQGFYDSISR